MDYLINIIGIKWEGIDNIAYNIEFLNEVISFKRPCRGCYNVLPSSAVIIAEAADSYITLLMDDEGIVYISIDVTDQLYCGGDFFDALSKIFFGLEYGEILCKPSWI